MKIPILDEVIRGVQSVGDLCNGNTDRAASRWSNWENDSFLGTAAKSSVTVTAAGLNKVCGNDAACEKLLEEASSTAEKLGAISLSTVYQVGGIGSQIVTFGVPNPVSGACNGAAAGINKVVNDSAEKKGMEWQKLGDEGCIGFVKGAVNSGGLIPYTGTIAEQKLRGKEKVEIDHEQEWANWGLTVGTTLISAGTVKGTSMLTETGKLGVRTSAAVAGGAGLTTGFLSSIASQVVNNDAEMRKILKEGYTYSHDMKTDDGVELKVFCKKGEPDRYVPVVYIGDAISAGLISGVTQAMAAAKQSSQIKKERKLASDNTKTTIRSSVRPAKKPILSESEKQELLESEDIIKSSTQKGENLIFKKNTDGMEAYVEDKLTGDLQRLYIIGEDAEYFTNDSVESITNNYRFQVKGEGHHRFLDYTGRIKGGRYNTDLIHDVYVSRDANGIPNYIGITSAFVKRAKQHLKSRGLVIKKIDQFSDIPYKDARAIEQVLINKYGLHNLKNVNNGIALKHYELPGSKFYNKYHEWWDKIEEMTFFHKKRK